MSIKLKAKASKKTGIIKVRMLVNHPMHTGLVTNKKTGKKIPANYISELSVAKNGSTFASGMVTGSVSKNPYFAFLVDGKKGDTISVSYVDLKGKKGSATVKSK